VALSAVTDGMARREREEIMVDVGGGPGEGKQRMAFGTVLRIPPCDMVGLGGGIVILDMTVVAFHTLRLEPEQRS